MRSKQAAAAAAIAVGAMLALPAAAGAATVTITGDDGNPLTLTPGAPPTIRTMDTKAMVVPTAPEKYYSAAVTGPAGPASSTRNCYSIPGQLFTDYQGNGTYTVNVTTYTNSTCTQGAKATSYQYNVAASAAITSSRSTLLMREPNSFVSTVHQFPIESNPGSLSREVRMQRGGKIGPDGGIVGGGVEVPVLSIQSAVDVRFSEPGKYVLVSRAVGFIGTAGQFFSPWSPPVTVRVKAPFDFASSPSFPDSRGPSYSVRATLGERSTKGKVNILMARGRKGGRFHSIGKAKIRRGVIQKKFTQHRPGTYRIRFVYKGSKTTARGRIQGTVTIRRRLI